MVVKISRVPLDRFFSNLHGVCKNVFSSEPEELFWKKTLFSFCLQKKNEWKMGSKYSKKNSNICHLPKKMPPNLLL